VLTVLVIIIALAAFTQLGTYAPWSPVMDAWSSDQVPPKLLEGRSALERQGALVFQEKQCRNCHALGGEGGQRGPALDTVATRLTGDQLIRQVLQGRGNMPAYGNNLNPAETTALVAYLKSLHPPNQKPAQDASLASATPASQITSDAVKP
jgi:ubiquinol-cytochrome c reductase cytochrome b subunit